MKQVFIVNPKGGSGKTTLATQLAGYYANRGQAILLIDRDPQKSSNDWLAARPQGCAKITLLCLGAEDLLDPSTLAHYDIIVNDMPAGWLPQINSAVFNGAAQPKIIIPMLPSPTDIKAGLRFIMALHRQGVLEQKASAGLIINRTRQQLRFHKILTEFLSRVDIPLLGELRDSQNYLRAMEKGVSIFDLPASAVAKDIAQWQPIIEWLTISKPG